MSSRAKGRRQRKTSDLRRQLTKYDPDQLWAVIVAAGASPGVRHRWASVGHLLHNAIRSETGGTRPVVASNLPRLVKACREDAPQLRFLEDFVASDPRERVLVRFGDDVLRLFPGNIERPVADTDRALLVADAVDSALLAELGFGVRDLLAASLRYTDHAIRVLAPTWPTGATPGDRSVTLTDTEVAAATKLISLDAPDMLSESPESMRALEWATCDADELPYEQGHPQSPFGRFLRVRRMGHRERVDWLPLAFLPEITGYGVVELARRAAGMPSTDQRFARLAAAQVRQALWRFNDHVLGPDDGPEGPAVAGDAIQWVAMCGTTKALLVQMVTELDTDNLVFGGTTTAQAVARAAAADPDAPILVPMAGGTLQLHPGTEVVPLLVIATAAHIAAPAQQRMMAVSLDDLRWMASTADADTDLFLFCRDMARPDLPQYHGWEAINTWEWWRANGKTFFGGGRSPTFISVAPHAGEAEWSRAALLSDIEQALATLRLPALRDSDAVHHQSSGAALVCRWAPSDARAAHQDSDEAQGAQL